jgi:uncharacterized protein (TIGR02679 family)
VMDAATRLGPRSGPLLCTEGVPTDAFWTIGRLIADSGSDIRVRADFDAAGCQIVAAVIERLKARPWRFDADAYSSALIAFGAAFALPQSKGSVPSTNWDLRLQELLVEFGSAVFEELVVDDLVGDLLDGDFG